MAIKKFKHKGLEDYFYDGTTKGITAKHAAKLGRILDKLDAAIQPSDMNLPGYRLHLLEPKKDGRWAVDVNGPWRVTFEFDGENATNVNYEQYH